MKTTHAAIESLEPRLAPAGIVTLTTANGVLTITGTNDSNNIVVIESSPGVWTVTESLPSGTTFRLNGAAADASVTMVAQASINMTLLGGALDEVQFVGLELGGGITVNGGEGSDDVSFIGTMVGGKASLDLGNGSDRFVTDSATTIGGALSFKGGAGSDFASLNGSTFGAGVTLDLGAGGNNLHILGNANLFGNLSILASGGSLDSQTIRLDGNTIIGGNLSLKSLTSPLSLGIGAGVGDNIRIGGGFSIQAGSGRDLINLGNTVFVGGAFSIQAGNGDNGFSQASGSQLTVGSFKFTGGTGVDILSFDGANFTSGAGASVNFGAGSSNGLSLANTTNTLIAGGLAVVGGTGSDNLSVTASLATIAGTISFVGAAGNNVLLFEPVNGTVGAISYSGGVGSDYMGLGDYFGGSVIRISIAGNVSATLGGGENYFEARDSVIQGNLNVTSASAIGVAEELLIRECRIVGAVNYTCTSTAASLVKLNDSTLYSGLNLSLGAGDDTVRLEDIALVGGPLTTIAGPVRVLLGAGTDTFSAGANPFVVSQGVNFLGNIVIDGGTGAGDSANFSAGFNNAFSGTIATPGMEIVL